jgi:hypothetical protein
LLIEFGNFTASNATILKVNNLRDGKSSAWHKSPSDDAIKGLGNSTAKANGSVKFRIKIKHPSFCRSDALPNSIGFYSLGVLTTKLHSLFKNIVNSMHS